MKIHLKLPYCYLGDLSTSVYNLFQNQLNTLLIPLPNSHDAIQHTRKMLDLFGKWPNVPLLLLLLTSISRIISR